MSDLRVVAAAHLIRRDVLCQDGDTRAVDTIISAPPPARHHNLFAIGVWPRDMIDSGFLLSDGTYCDRVRAAEIATANGQLTGDLIAPPNLYSEDLW